MRKVHSKDWWNYELTQFTSLKFYHQVLASVSFQNPGARSQMSHHTYVSDTKTQNSSEALCPVLLSNLDLQILYGWQSIEKRHELSFPTEWPFLLSQQKHQQRCSCLHSVASQTFPVACHRQLIFPLQSPWVLSIKAAARVVLWCVVKLPCYPECAQRGCLIYHCSAFTLGHHPSLPPQSWEAEPGLQCCHSLESCEHSSAGPFVLRLFFFFPRKCDFLYLVPNQDSRIKNPTSKFNWLCLMEGVLMCSLWPLSIIEGNKDFFLFHIRS